MLYKLGWNNSDKVVSVRNDDTRLGGEWFPTAFTHSWNFTPEETTQHWRQFLIKISFSAYFRLLPWF